jgi:hypothetical protein
LLYCFVISIAGDRMARVPIDKVDQIHTVVKLNCAATEAKLHVVENRVREWIPRGGAL